MKKSILSLVLVCLVAVWSCGEQKQESNTGNTTNAQQTKVTNPNGMSEMSLIMEDWYTVLEKYAEQLRENKKIDDFKTLDHEKILTAEVSKEKDNVHGEQFDAFSESFFYNYDNIGTSASYDEQVQRFNLAVKACINCHEQHCHGPIVRIKKLTVAPKQ